MDTLLLQFLMGSAVGIVAYFLKKSVDRIEDHINDKNIHPTETERKAMTETILEKVESHNQLDILRFHEMRERLDDLKTLSGQMERMQKTVSEILWTVKPERGGDQ